MTADIYVLRGNEATAKAVEQGFQELIDDALCEIGSRFGAGATESQIDQYFEEMIAELAAEEIRVPRPKVAPGPLDIPEAVSVLRRHAARLNRQAVEHQGITGLSEQHIQDRDAMIRVAAVLEAVPADWTADSSLETWFPITAEEVARLRAENAALRAVVADAASVTQGETDPLQEKP